MTQFQILHRCQRRGETGGGKIKARTHCAEWITRPISDPVQTFTRAAFISRVAKGAAIR